MAEKWTGVVIRSNVGELGDVPRTASSNSPDVAISPRKPLPDPSILTLASNYDTIYDNKLEIGWPNYLYVRGRNFTENDLSGTWNLFWATPNILLYPFLWQAPDHQLATSTGNKNPEFTIKAGQIGASLDGFSWVPPDTSDHYCMIAIANTPGHSNPLKGVNKITDLAEQISKYANIGWRNVQMVRGSAPEMVRTAGYSQGDEGARIDLAAVFKNFPKGSSYTIGASTLLNGKTLYHEDSNTKDNNFKYAWVDLDVPAQWSTVFTWTLRFGNDWSGIPPGAIPEVTIRGELVQATKDRLYHLGMQADPHPHTMSVRLDEFGGPVKVIHVGNVTSMFLDVRPR